MAYSADRGFCDGSRDQVCEKASRNRRARFAITPSFRGGFLANFLSGTPFELASVYSLANLAIIALVLWLVRRCSGRSPDMSDLPTLVQFVWIGGFLGPLTSASLSTLLVQALSSDFLGLAERSAPELSASIAQTFFDWFLTESMGMILITPAFLLVHQGISRRQLPSVKTLLEASALLTGSVIRALIVFGQDSYPLMSHPSGDAHPRLSHWQYGHRVARCPGRCLGRLDNMGGSWAHRREDQRVPFGAVASYLSLYRGQFSLTEMFERCDQGVAIAHDGNEAISMVIDSVVRDRSFDLVLMDM